MIGILKLENVDYHVSASDIRRLFKDHGARPEDIHIKSGDNWKHPGIAFVIFNEPREADNGLRVDGSMLKNKKLNVKVSSPHDFNTFFHGVPMFSRQKGMGRGRGRGVGRGPQRLMENNVAPNPVGSGRGNFRNSGGRGGMSRNVGGRGGMSRNVGIDLRGNAQREQRSDRQNRRDRSRSPIRNDGRDNVRESFLRNFASNGRSPPRERRRESPQHRGVTKNTAQFNNPMDSINDRKFVKISGLPYDVTEVSVSDFFRPILTRDVFFIRNFGGRFAGKPNGSAIVEFFTENDARQALKMNGRRYGSKRSVLVPAEGDDILQAIEQGSGNSESLGGPQQIPGPMVPDMSTLNAVANAHPQVQNLLTLLTATVNSLAGNANLPVQQSQQTPADTDRSYRNNRPERHRDDPVISRVANSANIDVNDIKMGRVVGIRNLPFSVTPDEILDFFRGYHVIPDSVRIHYLEDGRCSGDAIICFRGNREARNAVSALNKRSIGRRKVELFFL